jgi:3-phenylpropionate/trans-cinnamate dioxygenase ferredoxin subunit
MARVLVGSVDEIQEGTPVFLHSGAMEIAVFRLGDEFRAYRNRCPHQQGPVCHGTITGTQVASASSGWKSEWVREGRVLLCRWHAMEFDLETGERIRGRGERLRSFPVFVTDNQVFVDVASRSPNARRRAATPLP